jgi:hypothetical protein
MKKILMFFTALTLVASAFAQQDEERSSDRSDDVKTLMGKGNPVGGYGAISMQYTQIDNRDAFQFGAKGGILIGHMVTMGLGGAGFFNDSKYNNITGEKYSLAGGYGGFFFEPILFPKFPVHIAIPILIGAGGIAVVTSKDDNNSSWDDNYDSKASDAFMVIQPGVELELNVTRFFRFCLGAYYLYTSDVDFQDTNYDVPKDVLQGFSAGVTFKFGRF